MPCGLDWADQPLRHRDFRPPAGQGCNAVRPAWSSWRALDRAPITNVDANAFDSVRACTGAAVSRRTADRNVAGPNSAPEAGYCSISVDDGLVHKLPTRPRNDSPSPEDSRRGPPNRKRILASHARRLRRKCRRLPRREIHPAILGGSSGLRVCSGADRPSVPNRGAILQFTCLEIAR